jgi:diamine N-acetyltransferase
MNGPQTPIRELHRTAPCVTAPASTAGFPPTMQVRVPHSAVAEPGSVRRITRAPMNCIEFRKISLDNLDAVIALEVASDQRHLIADNLYSIAQSALDPSGWCRAAYLDSTPVGFLFAKELGIGAHIYLCRFMVDHQYQRRGLGRRIMTQLLAMLFSSPSVELVDLAVSRAHGGAQTFCARCGFTPTEESYRGGWRMVLTRSRYDELANDPEHRHAEGTSSVNESPVKQHNQPEHQT